MNCPNCTRRLPTLKKRSGARAAFAHAVNCAGGEPIEFHRAVGKAARILMLYGARTCFCGEVIDPLEGGMRRATVDHIIPRSRKGPSCFENYRLAHYECNHQRGTAPDRSERAIRREQRLAMLANMAGA